jgi:anti-sigma B factor antagonist
VETFRIKAVPAGGSCTLFLSGEADLANAPDIVELGTASLGEPGTSLLTVDLGALSFIDSTAIGALITLHNLAMASGKQLVLAHVPPRVRQVLLIAGLDHVFTIDGEEPPAARADDAASSVS